MMFQHSEIIFLIIFTLFFCAFFMKEAKRETHIDFKRYNKPPRHFISRDSWLFRQPEGIYLQSLNDLSTGITEPIPLRKTVRINQYVLNMDNNPDEQQQTKHNPSQQQHIQNINSSTLDSQVENLLETTPILQHNKKYQNQGKVISYCVIDTKLIDD